MVHTENRGGQTLTKRFHVFTNDPGKQQTALTVSGKVVGYFDVEPTYFRIMGPAGKVMTSTVRIVPKPDYPFTITEVKPWQGRDIEWELKPLGEEPAKQGYEIQVRNKITTAGIFRDYLVISTDLKQKPKFNVPINIRIEDQKPVQKSSSSAK